MRIKSEYLIVAVVGAALLAVAGVGIPDAWRDRGRGRPPEPPRSEAAAARSTLGSSAAADVTRGTGPARMPRPDPRRFEHLRVHADYGPRAALRTEGAGSDGTVAGMAIMHRQRASQDSGEGASAGSGMDGWAAQDAEPGSPTAIERE